MKKLAVFCVSLLILCSGCTDETIPQESEIIPATEGEPETILIIPTTETPEETILPDSVEIDENATSLDVLSYEVFEDRAVITDFNGTDTEITVTSHIGSYPVTEIGGYAFEAAWDVTSVILPESVTTINEQAFADCESLTSVQIPESVTSIGRGAFSNCLSLTELTLPASVIQTAEEMLTGCGVQDLYILNPDLDYQNWGLEDAETKCTIHAPAGAKILTWAAEHDFPTEEIS